MRFLRASGAIVREILQKLQDLQDTLVAIVEIQN